MARAFELDRWPFHLARAVEVMLPEDRVVVDLVLGRRVGVRAAAGVVGLHPGTVARRVKRLFDMQFDPLLLALCLHHDRLDPGTRSIAVAIHLHRRSQTELANSIGCSQRLISRRLSAFVGWARAQNLKPSSLDVADRDSSPGQASGVGGRVIRARAFREAECGPSLRDDADGDEPKHSPDCVRGRSIVLAGVK